MHRIIEITDDGSHTLFVPEMDEHYHSTHGAVQESTHIFINHGIEATTLPHVSVLEVGFGTGLNALLTLHYAERQQIDVAYHTTELYPLSVAEAELLNYDAIIGQQPAMLVNLHQSSWNEWHQLSPHFRLYKQQIDWMTPDSFSGLCPYDVIYMDAFAPEKQPGLWTQQLFDTLFRHTAPHGVLVTYCAKGIVRRMMQAAGYVVERLPGPPGKREMLRATKP